MPLILAIRSCLLSGEPLAAQGIARLKTLLSDRRGPCYVHNRPHSLTVALQEIAELLEVEETNPADLTRRNPPEQRSNPQPIDQIVTVCTRHCLEQIDPPPA